MIWLRIGSLPPGNVEWQDKNRSRCLVMWRSPQEWGQLIFQWVRRLCNGVTEWVLRSYCTVLWRVCQNGSKQQQEMAELFKACLSRLIILVCLIGMVCSSGVARTSLMLGHSMGILHLYEILRKVQKHLGGLGHALSAYAVSL